MKTSLKLVERVGERTGLKDSKEISAYMNFVEDANWDDGIIMYANTKHLFYQELLDKSSLEIQEKERKFWDDVGNHRIKENKSKLFFKAEEEYDKYLKIFVEKGLISSPRKIGISEGEYPVLKAYNYYNDSEVFEKPEENQRNSKWKFFHSK